MPRPIIIDTDPGTDDAVAILLALAAPELEVLSLVAVAGNLPLDMTERNARAILELAGRPEIPVYAGCPRPISPGVVTAEHAHGERGLGGLVLPEPTLRRRPEHGGDVLVEELRRAAPRRRADEPAAPVASRPWRRPGLGAARSVRDRLSDRPRAVRGRRGQRRDRNPEPAHSRHDRHRLARHQRPAPERAGHDQHRCRRI